MKIGKIGGFLGATLDPWTSAINRGLDSPSKKFGSWLNDITGQTSAFEASQQANWDMWNANNQYNSPANQMALYKAAGINPNLIAQASGAHSYASGSAPGMSAGGSSVLSLIGSFFGLGADLALKGAQARNLDAQAMYTGAQTALLGQELSENERSGTSRGTTDTVKFVKQAGNVIKAASQGVASVADSAIGSSHTYNMFDDVLTGSFQKNRDFYKGLPSKQKKIFKRMLKDLRGYSEKDFQGWD